MLKGKYVSTIFKSMDLRASALFLVLRSPVDLRCKTGKDTLKVVRVELVTRNEYE